MCVLLHRDREAGAGEKIVRDKRSSEECRLHPIDFEEAVPQRLLAGGFQGCLEATSGRDVAEMGWKTLGNPSKLGSTLAGETAGSPA
jgi:hypothetical protein